MKEQLAIQRLLSEKMTEARLRNPSYSIRAFSRKMGISSAAVSEILNGKRSVSRKLAQRIVVQLSLAPDEAQKILDLFPMKRADLKASLNAPKVLNSTVQKSIQLSIDEFKLISDWYHFAILSVLELKDAKNTPLWIAKKLKLTLREATDGIERLERLGMLKKEGKKFSSTGKLYNTSDEVVNLSLRKVHAQNLELARRSLEIDPIEERDFTAMTMAINPKQIPSGKKMIRKFRDQLCAHLEKGEKKRVYKVCMQLIPLSTSGEEV